MGVTDVRDPFSTAQAPLSSMCVVYIMRMCVVYIMRMCVVYIMRICVCFFEGTAFLYNLTVCIIRKIKRSKDLYSSKVEYNHVLR
jgi:hypothetical protein